MSNNIKIITWNARGIQSKKEQFFDFLISNNIQICLLTETWLQSQHSIKHKEFYIYRNDRNNSKGGGVAIIIRKNLKHKLIPIVNTNLIENIGIKLFFDNNFDIDIYILFYLLFS